MVDFEEINKIYGGSSRAFAIANRKIEKAKNFPFQKDIKDLNTRLNQKDIEIEMLKAEIKKIKKQAKETKENLEAEINFLEDENKKLLKLLK